MQWPSRQAGNLAKPETGRSSSPHDGGPTGAITLAESGLITRINRKAADLLGTRQSRILGKPFILFVERSELAVFFSHWNKLLSTFKNQLFEITLKGAAHKTHLECSVSLSPSGKIETIQIVPAGKADQAPAPQPRIQSPHDLPALIFAISSGISEADAAYVDRSIEDALGKIGLFAEADYCFIHSLNRTPKRIDPVCEWRRHPGSGKGHAAGSKCLPLSQIKNIISRLHREKLITFHDAARLNPAERNELHAWHGGAIGAGIFYFIRQGSVPVGVVGVSRKAARAKWTAECESLVRFFGDFMAGRLLSTAQSTQPAAPPRSDRAASRTPGDQGHASVIGSFKQKKSPSETTTPQWEPGLHAPRTVSRSPEVERPMTFEPSTNEEVDLLLPVLPGDNRQVALTCPNCGKQQAIPFKQLFALGHIIRVTCPCSHRFTILFDKRKNTRKSVRLEAIVTWVGDAESTADRPKNLGWMAIMNLSKGGLRLASVNARHLRPGDLLTVRFNLDNSSGNLIQKLARVTSVNGDEVGCRFEVADQHDITLGFYLM